MSAAATPRRPAIIIAATPTPNGDLHLGHLAGPYLASDIYARYLRASGRQVIYTTCTDDSQSYVATMARRRGTTPQALSSTSTAAIQRSIEAMGISMTALPPIDERYREAVLAFVGRLHAAGRFELRTVRLPCARRGGTFLYDGFVSGTCPQCLSGSCGGACEACGHPNNYDELLDPVCTLDPDDPVVHREQQILVLPMERYRQQLVAYYAQRRNRWRPHAMQLIEELLARPLPEIPITVPGTWGIAAPFAPTPGQILYPWIEAMPASMYATWWAAAQHGSQPATVDQLWLAEADPEIVYFHGFDNVYFWGLLDLVMLLAHGPRYAVPAANVCNEFYDLHGQKFSTSRDHLRRCADVLPGICRDLLRFHLALTAPEYQRSSFDPQAMHEVTGQRLVRPWNELAAAMERAVGLAAAGTELPTGAAGRQRAAAMASRLAACYELAHFSISRAADTVATQLAQLAATAASTTATSTTAAGDLVLQVRTLLSYAAPILIDVTERCGADLRLAAELPSTVAAFTLPRLPDASAPESSAADDRQLAGTSSGRLS